jgi:hypothetical protein
MKKLPIGIQSFTNNREDDYLYVDKTADIYRMVSSGKVYFLSRPRRFGKSLLISTLEALFRGRKNLFEGLYIYDKWDWTKQHPVIRIDWTLISHATSEEIEISLSGHLRSIAQRNGVTLTGQYASDCFAELIRLLYEKTGKKAVVLIDEYDVPILDVMGKTREELKAIQEKLHAIYKVLKGADDYLQFVFLTGVSKFAGLSIFSALNNLKDITLDEQYATICGYTQQELESYFPEHLGDMAQSRGVSRETLLSAIKQWYNGYSWDGKITVYNPFSTLLFLDAKEFANYWFRTGTPTFLIELIQKTHHIVQILEPQTVSSIMFDGYDPANIAEIPLLFQTGYLTVKKKEEVHMRPQYTLGFPNMEVSEALTQHLLSAYTGYPVYHTETLRERMWQQLRNHDTSGLEGCLREMLAGLPYLEVVKTEAWYHSIMLLWLRVLGFELIGEMLTNVGRIDAVWFFPDHAIVVEVKSMPDRGDIPKLLDEAMSQIRERRYYERFLGERQVSLLAVAFSGNEIGCRMEALS